MTGIATRGMALYVFDGKEWKFLGPVGHLIRRHGNVVMFHPGKAGTYTLNLPKGMSKVKELYFGREYDSSEIVLKTEGTDTFLFKAI